MSATARLGVRRGRTVLRRALLGGALALGLVGVAPAGLHGSAVAATAETDVAGLYLVTLDGPGTAAVRGVLPRLTRVTRLLAEQEALLDEVGAPAPVYRWTSALNGFAVRISPAQAEELAGLRGVALVEPDSVRPLAALPHAASGAISRVRRGPGEAGPGHGGTGEVIGIVDTGLAPESPLFAQAGSTDDDGFAGDCQVGPQWSSGDCNGKVVGARWFVDGFGVDHLRAASVLSPRDTDGHGTEMASIAAGNAGVPVTVGGERLGRFGGMAPDASIAVYKACWSAPDPAQDGCSTADLVTAVDRATTDGVDVLNLSIGGPATIDTLERALLGAVEAGVVVTAAAGNGGPHQYAAHPAPWVTTVGGTSGSLRRGEVRVVRGPRLGGAMLSRRGIGPRRVVLAARVPAAGATHGEARVCAAGSLDATRVAGAVVVCERGRVGRVAKSDAVALADGVGMVLVNVRRGSIDADAQRVPTVHLAERPGRRLVRYVAQHPGVRVRLRSTGIGRRPVRVPRWSSPGSVTAGALKPDLVAPATGVLGAVPGHPADGWTFVTGSSAAAAYASGVAASLLSRRGWTPPEVRSALVTTAAPLPGSAVISAGAGRLRSAMAAHPGLGYLVRPAAYRAWLDGRGPDLDTPSILLADGETSARRTVTNLGHRDLYFSSSAVGFRSDVRVVPAAVRLAPGESATYTLTVPASADGRVDDGYVVWRGATGSVTRAPVVIAR